MRKFMFFALSGALCMLNFGANAATKQQSVSAGTKVAAATENTVVPRDCQDAFYGCMDAFCMLDNAAGGRCQCSDRITELDQALEEIIKLDEQTYLMATEGVELIQMGEAESQVVARAKAAADKVVAQEKEEKKKTATKRTLDLSAWNGVAMIDDGSNVFNSFDYDDSVTSLANKKGDDLLTTSARMCRTQLDEYCQTYGSMLQLVYSQKVKSDCVAYENSLRIQKNQSQQKLQTAQKALRDAALDEYQNQNKYATVGECAIAFAQCMQTTAECGTDYTGCVTLAAAENVRNNKSGTLAKQKKIKGAISGADVSLAASTMGQLLAKKPMCESVTKQCVNANQNDAVWDTFLRNAAPALKSAELVAEQKLRSECIPSAAECFKKACRSEFMGDDESYDMCLSNPETYKSLCKVQLEPCLEATGGSYDNPTASTMWTALVAMLNSMKVDACTAEIKTCLMERCGDDYSECIGLDVNSVGNLCPVEKLTACVTDGKYADGRNGTNTDAIREYVAEIAQGLTVQIDNALVTACQNAADDAMVRVCGDTQTCESAQFDLSSLKYMIKPMACRYNNASGANRTCYPRVAQFGSEDNRCGIFATLTGKPSISAISYDEDGSFVSDVESYSTPEFSKNATDQVVKILNGALNRIMTSIKSDPRVRYCMEGRKVQGFNGFDGIDTTGHVHFKNLVNNMRATVAENLLSMVYEKNTELEDEFEDALDELSDQIADRLADEKYSSTCTATYLDVAGGNTNVRPSIVNSGTTSMTSSTITNHSDWCTCDRTPDTEAKYNDNYISSHSNCLTETDKFRYIRKVTSDGKWVYMTSESYAGSKPTVTDTIGSYDKNTGTCTIQVITYKCDNSSGGNMFESTYRCKKYDNGVIDPSKTRTVVMSTYLSGIDNVNSGKQKR